MKELIQEIETLCERNNFDSERLVDFLRSFFGDATVEGCLLGFIPEKNINVLVLQKNIFFSFKYNKSVNEVKATSIQIRNLNKIEETFDGEYNCCFYSNEKIIYEFDTLDIDSIRRTRDFINSVLARM